MFFLSSSELRQIKVICVSIEVVYYIEHEKIVQIGKAVKQRP